MTTRPLPAQAILGVWCAEPWVLEGVGKPAVFMSRAGLDEYLERYGEKEETTMQQSIPEEYLNQIVAGDARVLAERIPDESIDLIFTDPIYSDKSLYDALAAIALRVLKPAGALLCWSNGKWHRTNANWLEAGGLTYRRDFSVVRDAGADPMNGKIIAACNRVIWLDKVGTSRMIDYLKDGYITGTWEGPKEFHWTKHPHYTDRCIRAFCPPDGIVLDPFCGGATNPARCKVIARSFIAFEIDPDTAAKARARLAHTQAIDPVFLEEQQSMELDAA